MSESELDSFRAKIDKIAVDAEYQAISHADYCRLHPEDPICHPPELRPRMARYEEPPQAPVEDYQEDDREPEPEPEPEPEIPPKPPQYPPKPPPSFPQYPPKPPVDGDDWKFPFGDLGDETKYSPFRGPRGAMDMWTKTCPRCNATLPAGTNFCPRCGDIVEPLHRGSGGKGGSKGQGT